jgi:septum site-determining protein MinC
MIVDGHVRSGQHIYAQGRDLIVTGNVHSGAEILADGNIHVLGKLAGRAHAGLRGRDKEQTLGAKFAAVHPALYCVITCQRFAPELVAIGNVFNVCETVPEGAQEDAPALICLDESLESIVYKTLHSGAVATSVLC